VTDEDTAKQAYKEHREANIAAMRSKGFARSVHLWFANFFLFIGDELSKK
jgi:hypothetical protein